MSFPARYDDRCRSADCHYGDRQISAGDHIAYVDDQVMHAVCAHQYDLANEQHDDESGPCPLCWEYHRGECA